MDGGGGRERERRGKPVCPHARLLLRTEAKPPYVALGLTRPAFFAIALTHQAKGQRTRREAPESAWLLPHASD